MNAYLPGSGIGTADPAATIAGLLIMAAAAIVWLGLERRDRTDARAARERYAPGEKQ